MNEIAQWIQQYGYVAVFVGTFFEGESVALLGGFIAHGELLDLKVVMLVSFIGSFLGDQTAFWLGRRYGSRWKPKSPMVQRRMAQAEDLLNRYQIPVLLGFRFVYGIRNATPFVAGSITAIAWPRFVLLERCGCADLGNVDSRNRLLLRPHGGVAAGVEQNLRSRHPGRVGQRRSAAMVDTVSASATPGCTIDRSRR